MDILEDNMIRLGSFASMARDIAQSRTLAETVDRVMHHIGAVFAPLSWSLLLRDSRSGTLKFVHATGPGSQSIRGLVLERGKGVAGWVAENGVPLLIADVQGDSRFHPGIDEVSGFITKSIIAVPLVARGQVYGVIELINKLNQSSFDARDLLVLQTIADFAAIAIERAYYLKSVKRLALTDPLTGLANRRAFEQILDREIEKTRRTGSLFALLFLDIDHFKSINDRFGHQTGDDVLRVVAKILTDTARKVDCPCRLGGDEFVLLLPETAGNDASFVVRRLQHALDEHNRGAEVTISVSIGSRIVDPQNPDAILAQADRAMYDAKAQAVRDPSVDLDEQLRSWFDEEPKD